ncbi:MAG: hypothetical protein PHF17_03235 [Arcobacteraceae bacterium]|jgi:tetraacyldisaccharide-1-P 4'-kinase|nr:hypothetical protein [Arcobacteraceae bacterium]
MKLFIGLLVLVQVVLADTNSSYNIMLYNQKQEPSVENNFVETQYFKTTDSYTASGVLLFYGLTHIDELKKSLFQKDKQRLKTDFEDHKNFE